jgi:hypothetical protein
MPQVDIGPRTSHRAFSSNNLKIIGLGFVNFRDASSQWPAAGPVVSWRARLLPYLDEQSLADKYRFDRAWDDPSNAAAASVVVKEYQTSLRPSKRDDKGRAFTSFALVTGQGTAFPDGKPLRDIPGTTIIVGEAEGLNMPWAEPRDADVGKLRIGINLPGRVPGSSDGLFSSYWNGVAHVLRADGSVEAVHKDVDPEVLRRELTVTANPK